MMGSAYAQSTLPACQGSELRPWKGCFGSYTYDNGTEYIGEFKYQMPHGKGTMGELFNYG